MVHTDDSLHFLREIVVQEAANVGTQTEADASDFLGLHFVGAQIGEHVAHALGDGLQVAHRLHVARGLGQGTVVHGYQIVRAPLDVR